MKRDPAKRGVVTVLALLVLALSACAVQTATVDRSAEQQTARESRIQAIVRELLEKQAAGRVRTISGVGWINAPMAVPLAHGTVSLIPSVPDLEADLIRVRRQWLAGKRQPLPPQAFEETFGRLTAHRVQVGEAGGEELIRFAETDERGGFTFGQVPEGRWLLVADMTSPVSILLWTIAVEVEAYDHPPVFLTDANLLLEARTSGGTR
jgi:hypothetical protein